MRKEIERKFLVKGDQWRRAAQGSMFKQGFLSKDKERVVRVRIADGKATFTIKGVTVGITKAEFEYFMPTDDAEFILAHMCHKPLIQKMRYRLYHGEQLWEIDEFLDANDGLIVAEAELTSEDQPLELPEWVGEEVSHDHRYFNSNLVDHPYSQWGGR